MSEWVNFKELRSKLDFEMVLRHYGVEIKRKRDQHHGFCPLPSHQGTRNSASFSANLKRGIFQCFGCGAKGNILEFAAMMEKISLADGPAFRGVALRLQQRFCAESGTPSRNKSETEKKPTELPGKQISSPLVVNAPLDFELKDLNPEHEYLLNRGFVPETVAHFGLGFCSRGLLKDRVAIPLHDYKGRLIGYAGRIVDDAKVNERNPRYRFPSKRERDGKVLEFRKTRFLYNGCRIKSPVDNLIVVESFTAVWWLWQNGLHNVVATMGADCADRQAELLIEIAKPGGTVWIFPDSDVAGERFAHSVLHQVSPFRAVRWVKLDQNKQPTDCSPEQLKTFLPSEI